MLSRPGALPRLLAAAAQQRRLTTGAGAEMAAALQSGATMARLPPALSFDDLASVLAQARDR